ncbi:RhuM family protein [Sedimenticola hydrogenitrophicus]|uniref:RhuM family protein n=1 Tax=Sedimenticola hydrogenitrophicus TaxID=2967975 RepID=UPI003B589ACB
MRKFRRVLQEGRRQVRRDIDHYNLDTVISVGCRVNSKNDTQFRSCRIGARPNRNRD